MNRRSRNGCIDCRKSKVKCDEIRPFCGTCTRRRHICQGYATPPPTQTASQTGKHSRRNSAARGRSQGSSKSGNAAAEDGLESSASQAQSSPSDHSSSTASPPATRRASLANHPVSRSNEPVSTSLFNKTIPKAGHAPIMDTAQLLTTRALCLVPPGVINHSDEATIEVYFTRHPYEIIIGPEFVNEMNANVLMVLQHNPHATVDALSAIGHSYLTSSAPDSSLMVLSYKARILATLRQMGHSKHDLEDMILLLLGLCAMELVDSETTPPETTIPVIVANAASLINHHVSSGREVSSLARYFIRALARQDVIISMVQLRRLTIPTSVWLDEEARRSADRLMGYTSTLMPLLEELCALAEDVRNLLEDAHHQQHRGQQQQQSQHVPLLEEGPPSTSSLNGTVRSEGAGLESMKNELKVELEHDMFIDGDFRTDDHSHNNVTSQHPISESTTTAVASDYFSECMQRAEDLRMRIELWKPRLPHGLTLRQSRRFLSQASCYRSGALLYLFRLLRPPSTPSSSTTSPIGAEASPPPCQRSDSCSTSDADGEATAKAHEVLMAMSVVNGDELKMLLWPVFLAACEMSVEEDRQTVLDLFEAILAQRRTVTAQRTKMFVVNRVWTARDEGRDWNWMVLAREFPGECLPI
ncbi:hypothetical protein VMCG_09754 [Cytospora schulzeri]|uniref:Zn(2)-C6 fungal-type domain-containing protein n=1 Tax=Cytospora schulzeri TaxID=448051 RepID=A0A423VGG3_9PEZI|nr:hypothetical protein VMCG_09754 [Valsa malicola]